MFSCFKNTSDFVYQNNASGRERSTDLEAENPVCQKVNLLL